MSARNVVLLEFNELCPSLMHRFMSQGELPNFQRLFGQSLVYTTQARERAPQLDPWIQWVTVHTGLDQDQHQVEKLGEGHQCGAKRIWDFVSEQGGKVWICGSMSTRYEAGLRGALVPDPWTTKTAPTPVEFAPYFRFVQSAVLDSTKKNARLSKVDSLKFLAFMASHGLRLDTVGRILKQLLGERSGHGRWKRVVLLDRIQLDLFRHYWRKTRPVFSTFFLNSTAHFQHMHWREMEPELFTVKPSDAERQEYEKAILFGYKQMDEVLGDIEQMVDASTTLVLATAISQQPCLTFEAQGGKNFYRPHDFARFLTAMDVADVSTVAPVMAHQFHIEFNSDAAAVRGEAALLALEIEGQRLMAVERNGTRLFAWCSVTTPIPADAQIASKAGGAPIEFYSLFYKVDGLKSGMHHPDGILWIRQPSGHHQVFDQKVDLNLVAPTLMNEMGLRTPSGMRGELLPGYESMAVAAAV